MLLGDKMKRVLQAVLVIVLVGLTVLATTGASGEHPMEKVEGKLDGQKVRVNLPPTTDPKGVAIYFHGQGGNYSAKMGSGWLDALRRDGWAVASSNFHGANWGNPASTSDLEKLWDWAEEQSGGEVKLFIAGSMGGVTSLNSIVHSSKGAPACWYGVKTATDMTTMGAVPGARRFISQAYGGQPFPRDRNPANTAFKLARASTRWCPTTPTPARSPPGSPSSARTSRSARSRAPTTTRRTTAPTTW